MVAVLVVRLYFGLGLYRLNSEIHRAIYDRKWKDTPLPAFSSLSEIAMKAKTFSWKQDGIKELGDAVCTPQKVQAVGFDGTSPHGNDCDEAAIWLANVITENIPFKDQTDKISQGIVGVYFMTVMWYTPEIGFGGHNACLIAYEIAGVNFVRYMDYGMPNPMKMSTSEIADQIVKKYAPEGSVRLPWVVSDKDLSPLMLE